MTVLAIDFDLSKPDDDQEVFLICTAYGERTIIMARRHRFEGSGQQFKAEPVEVIDWAWQSTFDGRRILHPFVPYAWAPLPDHVPGPEEAPDDLPAADPRPEYHR